MLTSARLLDEDLRQGGFRGRWVFATLTYADLSTMRPRDVSECMQKYRGFLRRRGFRFGYVSKLEVGSVNGRPHFHLLLWVPRGVMLPRFDEAGWWPHGMTQLQRARSAIGYMAKYCTKASDGNPVPKGRRMYGSGGLQGVAKAQYRWWMLPRYARELGAPGEAISKVRGGGYVHEASGTVVRSPVVLALWTNERGNAQWLWVPRAEVEAVGAALRRAV